MPLGPELRTNGQVDSCLEPPTARLPDGHPEPIGRLLRWALEGKADEVLADLRAEGFVLPTAQIDAQGVHDFLRPMLDPVAEPRFHFTRAWMQEQAARIADPRTEANRLGRQLNLPPAYLLIHRVTIGSIGVLCQLDAEADWRAVLERPTVTRQALEKVVAFEALVPGDAWRRMVRDAAAKMGAGEDVRT